MSDWGDHDGHGTHDGRDGKAVCEGNGLSQGDAGLDRHASGEGGSRPARGRRRVLLAACAAFVAAIALGVPGSGCLNPRPEELPSGADPDLLPATESPRETCDDNPLLAGCDLPDQDINGSPIDAPPADSNDLSGPAPQEPDSAPEAGASAGEEASGDAGSDVPADAGAP